jgi:amino acid transporter
MSHSTDRPPAGDHHLKAGVLTLPGVLMQSVTVIAPAVAALFTVPFIASNAGSATPFAYLCAFVIALFLGYVLAQYSRHLSSSGSYHTFVSRSLGGRPGFLVAWIYLLFYPVVVAQVGSFMGDVLQGTLKAEYGIDFPWWVFMALLIALCTVAAYRGVELSVKLLVVLGAVEIVIVVALGFWGFFDPGSSGVSIDALNPASAPDMNGLALGVVFAIFAITGWDAAAPLAEESTNPRRTIPRAVLGSIVILGVLLVFASWGQISGFDSVDKLTGSTDLPAFVLGKEYWGAGWWLILFALLNSALAVAIGCTNAACRFMYGMARAGALPAGMAKVHPTLKTPVGALYVQTGISVALGLLLPVIIGVSNVYNLTGTWFTFALAIVYAAANVGLPIFYRREHPDEFSIVKHIVVPAVGTVGLAAVVWASVDPLPDYPISLAPFIVLGWLAVGAVTQALVYRGDRAALLARAGVAMGEATGEATADPGSDHHEPLPDPAAPPPDPVR